MRRALVAFLTVLSACSDSKPPAPPAAASSAGPEKSKVISRGEAYAPADYLVPGYVTVLDFYADW
jgi:hypothetical protein